MKTTKRLFEGVVIPIYRQMFKEAEPSADLDKLLKSEVVKEQNWFMNYYLPIERQNEIVEAELARHRLRKFDIDNIKQEVALGCSPNTYKEPSEEVEETSEDKIKRLIRDVEDLKTRLEKVEAQHKFERG